VKTKEGVSELRRMWEQFYYPVEGMGKGAWLGVGLLSIVLHETELSFTVERVSILG
jgi:hypothetical protein